MSKLSATAQRVLERRKQVIRLITEHGDLSKNDIFKMTRYSISTVISTVDELYADGAILPSGTGAPSVGRPAQLYTLNPDYGYCIGVDINSSSVNISMLNFRRETVKQLHVRVDAVTLNQIILSVPELIQKLLDDFPTPPRILSIGVAAPGIIDTEAGTIVHYSRFDGERNVPVTAMLQERFHCPVYIDKSLNCLATAYKQQLTDHPLKNMVLFSIRTGVGMSCILDGEIYRGATGQAGEIGHMRLPNSTALCKCKKVGCLDAEVSIYSITQKLDAIYPLRDENGEELSMARKMDFFLTQVQNGQPECLRILDEICYHLSYAVSFVINLLNPSDIFFYGEITQCGDLFLERLRGYMDSSTLCPGGNPISLGIASLSKFAFSEGAAYYALDNYLKQESHYIS